MKTVMLVFGTRPEAIKMCPLVKELKKKEDIRVLVCVSGQHREMLDSVLNVFGVVPDYDLSVMKDNQNLFDITSSILQRIKEVLIKAEPDLVLVHGDTSTAFSSALAAFYLRIPIGHVEAGLRSRSVYDPYPEEFNRRAISVMAKYHFAPTDSARDNLLREGVDNSCIYVTGNTSVDALNFTVRSDYSHRLLSECRDSKIILVTVHRRENI